MFFNRLYLAAISELAALALVIVNQHGGEAFTIISVSDGRASRLHLDGGLQTITRAVPRPSASAIQYRHPYQVKNVKIHLSRSRMAGSSSSDGYDTDTDTDNPVQHDHLDDNDRTTPSSTSTVASQAALIAGTTIGGGFLALPTATAPCGAAPAAFGLVVVWLFLLAGALSLSDAIFMIKNGNSTSSSGQIIGDDDETITMSMGSLQDEKDISLFSLVRTCFGNTAGILCGVVFLLLIKVTLIAQLSKIGVILEGAISIADRRVWTALFSVFITIICLIGKQRNVERINDVLTATMLFSFTSLVAFAGGSGWTMDGLVRADYKSLLPSFTSSSSTPWAIPIFIQLLIYNEVVPLVSSRLGDKTKVRQAIVLGSAVPLIMCLVWSSVALGLVPYEPLSVARGTIYDPLTNLKGIVLSKGGFIGKTFLASVNVLACSAICTTVIGSVLASVQYFDDIITNLIGYGRKLRVGATKNTTHGNISDDTTNIKQPFLSAEYRKLITYVLAVAPSAIIALQGSSDLYYRMTSFAGEFPCTLLYGLIPPLCNLRLRWMITSDRNNEGIRSSQWKDVAAQMALAIVSSATLIVSGTSK